MNRWTEFKLAWEMFQAAPTTLNPEQKQKLGEIARRQSLIEQAVLSSPEAAGVVVPLATVDARLAEMRARYASNEDYRAELQATGLSEPVLAQEVARDLRVEAVLDKVAASVPVASEVDAELHYRLNPAAFTRPETRQLRHILITFNDAAGKQAARATLEALRNSVGDPEAFGRAALGHSQCPTAMQGGLLGMVKRGQLYTELEPAAFALAEGELSGVLESPVGLHLLWCERIFPDETVPFADVRERVMSTLTEKRQETARRQWVKSLLAGRG